ncbi:MAG: LysM peptidoglycan-binding domain-containing protein [Flavobacterium sp.]|nr:LysM peptidoglycan-binding domain-containing protein [Flavobacterium sp.]
MKQFLIFFSVLLMAFSGQAQDKIIKHTVAKGETITQIAEKYKVKPADIYRLNPDSQNGVKPDMILLIQGGKASKEKTEVKTAPKKETASAEQIHVVAAKETLYGLSKTYNVTVEALQKANPGIENGLQVGATIKIPSNGKGEKTASKDKKDSKKKPDPIFHTVEAKETKYSIAKQYNTTVEAIDVLNPEVKNGLQIGFRLKIIQGEPKTETIVTAEDTPVVIKPIVKKAEFVDYEVKPKETLYSLTKKTGLSQEELAKINPELKDGLKDGMTIKLPANITLVENAEKEVVGLAKTIKLQGEKKQLVLLLPFNISKIEGDTLNSTAARLKTDKFLNMTLDFYSGALMAIDSAKTLNLNIDIKILDSQETKNSSGVASLIQNNNLQKADVIIGPFYQANVEKTAELLGKTKVPVISPLSKEPGKSFPNLFQSMPSAELVKNGMLDYMRSKDGNMLAIVDPKKLSTKQFLQNHKDVKLIGLNEKNQVISDSLSKKMVKGKKNFVILDSEKTGTILNTLNVLIALSKDFEVQLVILEKNETLDFEEIPLSKLAQLKLLYPSITRDNDTPEALIFEREYKEHNKIFPNQYATRGFDVVLDAMLRLSQEKSFSETIDTIASEQVENKFEYEKRAAGGYANKAFYILYYDTDLSVKEAN